MHGKTSGVECAGDFPLYVLGAPAAAAVGVFGVAVGVIGGEVWRGAGWSWAALGRILGSGCIQLIVREELRAGMGARFPRGSAPPP